MKNFFLMGQGDVFVHFMDMAEHELRKVKLTIFTMIFFN